MAYQPNQQKTIRSISLTGEGNTLDRASVVGLGAPAVTEGAQSSYAAAATGLLQELFKKDRVDLTPEAHFELMKQRSMGQMLLDYAGQMYSNVVTQLRVGKSLLLKLMPYGYQLVWLRN